jgi:two-component sensor histidine kinase
MVFLKPDHPVMLGIALSDKGRYATKAVSDGVYRYYAYDRVGNLPLYAVAGIARSGVIWAWLWQTTLFGVMVAIVALLVNQGLRAAELGRMAEFDRLQNKHERELREAAEETAGHREIMLRELHHRVKNNLSMISGLIKLEHRRAGGPNLEVVNARVIALGRIHDLLHRSDDSRTTIDLWALIHDICISDAVVSPERGIVIEALGRSIEVEEKHASPIALALIELVTNAQKHAFGKDGGRILVALESGEGTAKLHVEDNGRGMPPNRSRSSGILIVEALVRQMGGQLDIASGQGGTKVTISFPLTAERT